MAPQSGAGLDIYLTTFNCGRELVSPTTLAPTFFSALPSSILLPSIIAISLQEVAPIAYSFLAGSYIEPYFTQVTRTIAAASAQRLQNDGDNEVPKYVHILTRHIGMTALMVFALEEVSDNITWIQTAGTGVGLWSMGNKGAVAARIAIAVQGSDGPEQQEVTFVAAHLAPFEWNLERRNRDFEQIVRNLGFTDDVGLPGPEGLSATESLDENEPLLARLNATGLYDTSGPIFFFGDLNYRTADRKPTDQDIAAYPNSSYSSDHPSHPKNYLERDQLTQELRAGRVLHHFSEAIVSFPPTYKLKHRSNPITADSNDESYTWAPHRFPSWCDRILYTRPNAIQVHQYDVLLVQESSDHRPVALAVTVGSTQGETKAISPYPLNPSFADDRIAARYREIIVGALAYLVTTTQGRIILGGVAVGAAVTWWALSDFL